MRLHLVGDQLVVADERLGHRDRFRVPHGGGALDVRQAKGHDTGRQGGAPAGPKALDQLARGGGPAGRVGRQPETDRLLETLRLRRVDPLPGRQQARRWRACEQGERRRCQRVDVTCARRRPVGGQLRGPEAGRAGPAARGVRRRRQAEVHELDAGALGQDQVRRLHVAVDDRGILGMEVRQGLRRLGEIRQHARRRQSWPAAIAEQLRQVGPVDPVHRDHVAVAVEEVLADQRQGRVRRNPEQDARLAEKLLARAGVASGSNLQGDKTLVLVVQRLDYTRLAADPERLEELVAIPEQRGHRAHRVHTNLPLVSRRAQAAAQCA